MDNMITIELTLEEKTALIQLLDGAQKFYGIQASKACAHFSDKITAAEAATKDEDKLNG